MAFMDGDGSPWDLDDLLSRRGFARAADLSSVSAGKGLALLGYSQSVTFGQGTAGIRLGELPPSLRAAPYNAVGDGVTSDAAAIASAHAAGLPIDYGRSSYAGDEFNGYWNLYGRSKYKTASAYRLQYGLYTVPKDDARPVTSVVKFSNADRTADPTAWDQTGYFGLVKTGGSAFGAALSASVQTYGGSGDQIAGHFRGEGNHADAKVWGGWSYAAGTPAGGTGFVAGIIAHEFNFNNKGSSVTFADNYPSYRGIVVVMADGSKSGHIGVDVGAQTGTEGWLIGARFRADGIVPPATGGGVTTQIQIEGSSTQANCYHGINFKSGSFKVGIDFREVSGVIDSNRAIALRPDHRIYWNEIGDATSKYISVATGDNALNLTNLLLKINGTQVVGTRKAGWGTPTGTATRTAFDTSSVTLPQLAERLKALIDDLKLHGLIGA